MSRADSILQTASMARWVSVAVTASNQPRATLRRKTTPAEARDHSIPPDPDF